MSGARLELAGIGKTFRGLRAVHDVSFAVPAGAIHALIGPNGAGKTTIFNMIAGVYAPTTGTVTLDSKTISGLRPDRVGTGQGSRSVAGGTAGAAKPGRSARSA